MTFGAPSHSMDSTRGISRLAMTLLGHKTDIVFRRYIQTHDEHLVEAANALSRHRSAESTDGRGKANGHKSSAASVKSVALYEEDTEHNQ